MDLNNEINGRVYAPYIIEGRWYLKGINIGSSRCQTSSSNSQQDAKIAALEDAIKKLTDVYVSGGEWVIEDQGEYILLKYSDGREPIKIKKPISDVTLTINKEDIFNVEGAGKYRPGTQVPLVAHVMEGYDFVGFFDGENLISNNPNHTYTIQKDVVIEARYARKMGTLRIELGEGVRIANVNIGGKEYQEPFQTEYNAPVGTQYNVRFESKKYYGVVEYEPGSAANNGTISNGATPIRPRATVLPVKLQYFFDGSKYNPLENTMSKWDIRRGEGPDESLYNGKPEMYGKTIRHEIGILYAYKIVPDPSFTIVSSTSGHQRTYTLDVRIPEPYTDGRSNVFDVNYRSQALPYITISGLDESQIGKLVTNSTSKYKYREGSKLYFEDSIDVRIPAKPGHNIEYNTGSGWKPYTSLRLTDTSNLEVRYKEIVVPKFEVRSYATSTSNQYAAGTGDMSLWLPTKEKIEGSHLITSYTILPTELGQKKKFNIPVDTTHKNQRLVYTVPKGYEITGIFDAMENQIMFAEQLNDNDAPANRTPWRKVSRDMLPEGMGDAILSRHVIRLNVPVNGNSFIVVERVS